MDDGAPRVVIVLGMHRSGTSVLTRGLQVLGVELSERLMPAAAHNPRGFWEDLDVVAINERALASLSKDWRSPILISDSQWHSPQLEALAAEAEQLLHARLQQHPKWGVKDPRLCLLLPFWQPIFHRLGLVESYVIAVRNPHAVVDSLEHLYEMVPELGYLLWLEYIYASLQGTANKRRVLVDYDEMIREPRQQLDRIARKLELPLPDSSAEALRSFEKQFLDPELRHHAHSSEFSPSDSHLTKVALTAFKALQADALERSAASDDDLHAVSDALKLELQAVAPMFLLAQQLDHRAQSLTHLRAEVRKLHSDLRAETHRLWNTRSWRLLRPGRNLIRRLHGHREEIEPAPASVIDALRTNFRMRDSASWELTAPLRLLHRVLGLRRDDAAAAINPIEHERAEDSLVSESISLSPLKVFPNESPSSAGSNRSDSSLQPLISVIIPSFNHANFVAQAIDSVAAQDHPNLQLIVIDDGSSDDSIRVIEEALRREPRLGGELYVQQNSGAHAAINRGLLMARGEYLTILNSDDYYYPRRLSTLLSFMRQGDQQFAFSEVDHVGFDGGKLPDTHAIRREYLNALDGLPQFPALGFGLLLYNMTVTSGNFLMRRSLFERIGLFHSYRVVHDWDYVLRVLVDVEPGFLREPLMAYRVHEKNTLSTFKAQGAIEGPKVIAHYFETVSRRKAPNPLAPTRYNWPHYFDRFVREYPQGANHRLVDFVPAAMH